MKEAEVLTDTKELTDLKTAFATLTTAKTELVTYLSDISARYNAANTEKKATIVSAVGTKFTNFQGAYSAFYDKLGLANAYITSKIYGDLGVVIGDVTSLAYLKKALMDAPDTEINGGLVLTSLIGLRDTDGNTTAGINGITEKSAKGGGVAAWFGGEMVDKDYNDGSKTPANTIFRFDGSGYVAGGAIWWGTDGRVHADPTSFIISEKNLGAYLTFFEPTWKSGSAGTSVADLVSLKPNAPFSKLGVSGDATFEGAITFHGISITYDATNKAIKVDGNLYATGGITAYGASSVAGGGGLNGSVKSYADALKLASESLSEIASAYSIKALDSRISSLEGGSAMDVSVSGSGNAVTAISKSGTTISVTKGTTFLTSHQSLDGYVNEIATSGTGNAITSVSKSGKKLAFTKGATFLTSHQSLAGYATQSWVNSKGYLTSHQDISGKVNKNGDTISGIISFTNLINNDKAINLDYNYSAGGFARDIISLNNSVYSGDEHHIANISVVCYPNKTSSGFHYIYIGSGRYGSENNLRIYKDKVTFGSNTIIDSGSIGSQSVKYAASAGSANSVAWSNVSGRPTKVSQFTNDSGYITSSASISGNAGSATKLATSRTIWGQSFNGTSDIAGLLSTNNGIKVNGVWIGLLQNGNVTTGTVDSSPNANLYLNYSSPNNVYIVTGGGKVGIGTTSPRGKLDVNGDMFGYNIYGDWIGNRSGKSFSIGANGGYAIDIDTNNVLNLRKGIKINGIVIGLQKDLVTASTHVIEDYDSNMFLNYYSTHNIYLCYGGGDVICGANILANGGITAYSSSDIRLKQDLRKLDYFGIIKAMGGTFGFAWKKDNTRSIGWIAQHVLCNPHLNDIVETDENGYYKINYWSPKLISTAFGAIEQVGDEVSRLKARVVFLESEVQRLSGKQDGNNKKRLDNKNINLLN